MEAKVAKASIYLRVATERQELLVTSQQDHAWLLMVLPLELEQEASLILAFRLPNYSG